MSSDPRIDAYIAGAQPFARPILEHVRKRVHAVVPGVEEAIKWGMPAYLADGKILLMTAAFKRHAALSFWRGKELGENPSATAAMGQFGRIESLDDLPHLAELDRLIGEAAELSKSAPAPRKSSGKPRAEAAMPAEFAAALDRAPAAKAALEAFPPSARRDYVEWIADAKQEATRSKRIATAIEWLSAGKRRNWKYEK